MKTEFKYIKTQLSDDITAFLVTAENDEGEVMVVCEAPSPYAAQSVAAVFGEVLQSMHQCGSDRQVFELISRITRALA